MQGRQATDAEMAGLAEANVTAFVDMGFPRDKVVSRCFSSLIQLKRTCDAGHGANIADVPDKHVEEAELSGEQCFEYT